MSKILEIRDHKNNLYTVKTFYKDVEGLEGQLTSLKDELNLSITNNVNKVETSITEYVKDSISKNNTSLNNQIKDLKEEVENVSTIKDNIETIVEVPLGKYRINAGAGLTGGGLLKNNPTISMPEIKLKSKYDKIVTSKYNTVTENVYFPNRIGNAPGKITIEVGNEDYYGYYFVLIIDAFSGEFRFISAYEEIVTEDANTGFIDRRFKFPMSGDYSTLINSGEVLIYEDSKSVSYSGWFTVRFYYDKMVIKAGGVREDVKDGDKRTFRVCCWG